MELEQKARQLIAGQNLIQRGDDVIVALSGGADSVALFHFLFTMARAYGIRLAAAHFEHGLRGQASLADAAFVEKLCGEYAVPLYLQHGEMGSAARPANQTEEEWARLLRYGFFARLAKEKKAKVATAHTLSDNAETVLFQMARGSGPRGLAGIPPKREAFIRPLLAVSRAEVEDYCRRNKLVYVTDKTNADERYARNRIRHRVLPQLELAHTGAAAAIGRMAADMREVCALLDSLAGACLLAAAGLAGQEEARGQGSLFDSGWPAACLAGQQTALPLATLRQRAHYFGLEADVLLAQPPAVTRQALALLAGAKTRRDDLQRSAQVLAGQCREADLHGGMAAYRLGRRFFLVQKHWLPQTPCNEEKLLSAGRFLFPGGFAVEVLEKTAVQEQRELRKNGEKDLTFACDCDKISWSAIQRETTPAEPKNTAPVLRTRRQADSVATPGGHTKSLKKWMIEAGIPRHLRGHLPLLARQGQVLWLWGSGFFGKGAGSIAYTLRDDIVVEKE